MLSKVSCLALGAAASIAVATLAPHALSPLSLSAGASSDQGYNELHIFGEVFEKIRDDYVDEPDESKLIAAAINGMLTSLDPHSGFVDARALRDMQARTKLELGDFGIELTQEDELIKVAAPAEFASASKAEILQGDIVTAIDGDAVQDLTVEQAVSKIHGSAKSTVNLKLLHGIDKQSREVEIDRDIVKVQLVQSHVESDDIGYIRIVHFSEQTADRLRRAMGNLRGDIPEGKFRGFILDLRNDGGGRMDQSIKVVNSFIDKGEIVSTRGRNRDNVQRFNAQPGGDLSGGKPLVVLINGGSASSSEIVAGALQDLKRATLIGTRSYGKGTAQTMVPLGQDGAMLLTTARYYTPSGRSIQAKGVNPDIEILQDVPEALKGKVDTTGEASLKGHFESDGDAKTGSQAYLPPDPKNDKQLIAAVALLHGANDDAIAPARSGKEARGAMPEPRL